jgi:hypothetical protein
MNDRTYIAARHGEPEASEIQQLLEYSRKRIRQLLGQRAEPIDFKALAAAAKRARERGELTVKIQPPLGKSTALIKNPRAAGSGRPTWKEIGAALGINASAACMEFYHRRGRRGQEIKAIIAEHGMPRQRKAKR